MKEGFIEKKFSEFADENYKWYMGVVAKASAPEKAGVTVGNFIECEAHREVILKGIKNATDRGETGSLG